MNSLTVVILAAGIGSRMKSKTPKVLQDVCGKTLLEWVIDAAKPLLPKQMIVVVGPDQPQIEQSLLSVPHLEFGVQQERRGTGHALQQVFSKIQTEQILVLCGDTPLIRAEELSLLLKTHLEEQNGATLISGQTDRPFGYGRILRKQQQVVGIVEEKDATLEQKAITEVNTGIYLFQYQRLKEYLFQLQNKNRQQEYYLTDMIGLLTQNNHRVGAVQVEDFSLYQGVNSFPQLAQVRTVAQQQILIRHMESGVDIVDPRNTYIDVQVKIGANTRILPFCVLSGPIDIGEYCVIGPFTHLRAGTKLHEGVEIGNFTEVKQSEIGKKSKAKHLSYLGDARIGERVNIGAGTITANYDGHKKWVTRIDDHAFIGSGTTLIAPVSVGKEALTGANSVVRQDVPDQTIVVGVPAKILRKKKEHE